MSSSTLVKAADADESQHSFLNAPPTELSDAPSDGFPFRELPCELRDKVYQHLLAGEYVSREVTNPGFEPSFEESESVDRRHLPASRFRRFGSDNLRIHTLNHQVSILRVNHQIYEEAIRVFEHENHWISVCVNRAGYGTELKKRGYAVKTCEAPDAIKRRAVLQVSATFSNDRTGTNHSKFMMATVGGDQLLRTLWTTTGMRHLVIGLTIHPSLAGKPTHQNHILAPYSQMRGVHDVFIEGTSQRKSEEMKACMKSRYTYEEVHERLGTGFGIRNTDIDAATEVRCLESLLAFWTDYGMIQGDLRRASRYEATCGVTLIIVRRLIMAKSKLQQHESIINYATYALRIVENKLALYASVPRASEDPWRTRTITSSKRNRVLILSARAKAYAGLNLDEKALQDLSEAKDLAPCDWFIYGDIYRIKKKQGPVSERIFPSLKVWWALRERTREDI